MATILRFPTERMLLDPDLRALRARIGPLTPDEAAGLRALDDGECDGEVLREYLAADIDGTTWKRWLAAYWRFG